MEWIRVKDKRPPQARNVLVAIYDARPKVKMYFVLMAERIGDEYFDTETERCITEKGSRVTHWMPIPDAPEFFVEEDD